MFCEMPVVPPLVADVVLMCFGVRRGMMTELPSLKAASDGRKGRVGKTKGAV